ncbi:hypothetical protein Tco_0889307, partial [Tanacetum coccineum]
VHVSLTEPKTETDHPLSPSRIHKEWSKATNGLNNKLKAEMSIVPIELDAKSVVAIVDGASRGDLYFVVPRGFTTGCTKQDGFGFRRLEIRCTEFLESLPDIFFVQRDPLREHLQFLDNGIFAKKQG